MKRVCALAVFAALAFAVVVTAGNLPSWLGGSDTGTQVTSRVYNGQRFVEFPALLKHGASTAEWVGVTVSVRADVVRDIVYAVIDSTRRAR